MRNRPKQDPVDPTPVMPRGETEFEEALIKRDFIAVFSQISNALFKSHFETHEYAYRAGRVAEKSRREYGRTIEGRKLPSYIQIL